MDNNHNTPECNSVDIALGYEQDIGDLFRFGDNGPDLVDAITFVFSQTLQRDMFFGSWAMAYQNKDGQYRLKITSPNDDVSSYQTLIPNYIAAGKLAIANYTKDIPSKARKHWEFLLPFGLAMANVKSIQLLHFPPLETFTYKDYLYSPTNRRWECLLAQNNFRGAQNTLVERIIDVAPIAAPGGAGKALSDYNQDFIPYVQAQLNNFLKPLPETDNKLTQPVVAYGSPVHEWLKQAFNLSATPQTLELMQLKIVNNINAKDAPYTWVLCANHPSEYLYDTDIPIKDADKPNGDYPAPIEVMCQDLVAAGWQAHMSEYPADDPHKTLLDMQERWGWDAQTHSVKADKKSALITVMKEQNQEFKFNNSNFTPSPAQLEAQSFAIQRSTDSDTYSAYAIDLNNQNIFSEVATDQSTPSGNRLFQSGGYIIEWTPASADDEVISYKVLQYDRNSANPLAERVVAAGEWPKEKFFGKYRSNFGATFDQIELFGFPGYVLSIIPAPGRRSYQLWSFDPSAQNDCLTSVTNKHSIGGFRDIAADRELFPIGNYVLDRKGANYKVWSFDPQSNPPLALPTIQQGTWINISEKDRMITLGENILTWQPDNLAAGCKLWAFNPKNSNPIGDTPIKTSPLPENFNQHSSLFGVIPSQPFDAKKQKTPGTIEFMRHNIEHVVYYMVESRSFDNVLGWLYKKGKTQGLNWVGENTEGFRGIDPNFSNKLPDGTQVNFSKYKDGKLSNDFVLGGPAQDPWHDNSDILMEMFHGYEGYSNRQAPEMKGFAWNQNSSAVLSSFTPEQLSVLNGLAENFGLSDDWFSSIPGGTDVNRGYSVSGSAYNRLGTWEGGTAYQDWPNQAHRQSIWKTLWSHGHQDWKIYYNILWEKAVFTYQLYLKGQISQVDAAWAQAVIKAKDSRTLPNSQWISPMEQFYEDIKEDKLPRFSYIEPAWVGKECTSYHPGSSSSGLASMVPAEQALNNIYEKLSANPKIWEKTLLVVTFDKNGGLADHVPPPYADKAWPNDVCDGFELDLTGPRVPAVFASPWIKPQTVMRADNGTGFDSTSFAATLLNWYGIAKGNWGMGDRIANAATIEGVLNASQPRTDIPTLKVPYDKDFPKKS